MSLSDCESCLSLSRQNGELRRAYDEMFKKSCEKTVYIAECEDAIDQLRQQVHDLTEAVNIEYVGSVAQARNAALEEAAKVAEEYNHRPDWHEDISAGLARRGGQFIAAAIRALKEKADD